jgi:hypothetical protein
MHNKTNTGNKNLVFTNNTFSNITLTNFTGGIFGMEGSFSSFVLHQNHFSLISTTVNGGVLSYNSLGELDVSSVKVINNCTFNATRAAKGGAICFADKGILHLSKCLFIDNIALTDFGGNDIFADYDDVGTGLFVCFFMCFFHCYYRVYYYFSFLAFGDHMVLCCTHSSTPTIVINGTDLSELLELSCVSDIKYLSSSSSSPPGNDANNCDIENPCATISHVIKDNITIYVLQSDFLTNSIVVGDINLQIRAVNNHYHTTIGPSSAVSNLPLFGVTTGFLRFNRNILFPF